MPNWTITSKTNTGIKNKQTANKKSKKEWWKKTILEIKKFRDKVETFRMIFKQKGKREWE